MKCVLERAIPDLTDEFVKQLGTFDSVEHLKKNIADGLLQEKKDKEKQRLRARMIEAIAEESKVEIPEILIERELDTMIQEIQQNIEQMGMKWEGYLLHIKKTIQGLRAEWQSEAAKRVRIALSLRAIAAQEHITPGTEEIEQKAEELLKQYGSPEDTQKQIDHNRLQEYARGIVKNEKVFELLERVN